MLLVGTDAVEISRIESLISNNRKRLNRIFTKRELELFEERNFNPQTVAVNFCSKEAFGKAIGSGVKGFRLTDLELLRNQDGKPYFNFYNKAAKIVEEAKLQFEVSATHTDTLAIVTVVAFNLNEFLDKINQVK